jgi:hypothetical protein
LKKYKIIPIRNKAIYIKNLENFYYFYSFSLKIDQIYFFLLSKPQMLSNKIYFLKRIIILQRLYIDAPPRKALKVLEIKKFFLKELNL